MWTSCLEGVYFRYIRGGGATASCFGSSSGPYFLGHVAAYGAWKFELWILGGLDTAHVSLYFIF